MIDGQSAETSSVLRRAAEVERRAREAVSVNEPLLFVVWGAVYLLGYGSLYVNVRWADGSPPVVGFVLFGAMAAFIPVSKDATSRPLNNVSFRDY